MPCPCGSKCSCTRSFGHRLNGEFDSGREDENNAPARGSCVAARIRVSQRDVPRTGRLVADRLGESEWSARLGCHGEKIFGFDGGVWRGRDGTCESARREGRAKANGQAASCHGRRASARAESSAGTRVE